MIPGTVIKRVFNSLQSLFVMLAFSMNVNAVEFTEIPSVTSGLNYVGETWGASWGDFNGDRYPDIYSSNHRARPSVWRNNGDGSFTDIVLQFDTSYTWHDFPTGDTHGGAWADFDNDGDQDLLVLTGVAFPAGLFVNDGVGITTDETSLRGIPNDLEGRLATWFDYDADGLLDFVINNRAPNIFLAQNSQNTGNFTDETAVVGLNTYRTNFGVLSDIDGDNQFELFGIADGDFPEKVYDIAYNGVASFADITTAVPSTGLVLDGVFADLDNDLLSDIFLVRGSLRPNQAIKVIDGALGAPDKIETWQSGGPTSGEKGITFQANGVITVTISSQIGLPTFNIGSSGYHPADRTFQLDPALTSDQGIKVHDEFSDQGFYLGYDTTNSEWQIFLSPGTKSTRGFIQIDGIDLSDPVVLNITTGDLPITPKYYRQSGGSFINISGVGLSQAVSCVSTVAGDFDNDMDLDLYLVCRNGIENIVNRLYLNNGDGSFVEDTSFGAEGITGAGLVSGAGVGENAVIADYDLDGWLDLYVLNGLLMNPIRVGGPDQLFRNTTGSTSSHHWIELDLVGTVSNRDAIGSKVLATAGGLTQLREKNGQYHRWSQNHKRTHFGLAQNTTVDIEVRWPNGDVDTFLALAADQLYEVTQGLAGSGSGIVSVVSAGSTPPFPAPQPGNECGVNPQDQPVDFPYHFDPMLDQGFFIWKDCATTGDWFVRATAGNETAIEYTGLMLSDQAFALVTPFDLEAGNDIVDNITGPAQIDFFLRMSDAGIDGFDFTVNAGADVCLSASSLPVNAQVMLGKSHLPVNLPLDLATLTTCIEFLAGDATFNEADGVVSLNINLSEALSTTATVDYTLIAGTASEGVDYSVVANTGTLTFLVGEISQLIDITLLQDLLAEGPETLSLQLSNATGAFVLDSLADYTINDDEINPCGQPDYDPTTEKSVLIWRDCTTGEWTVRVMAGGDPAGVIHTGVVNSTADFINVTGFSIESNDVLDTSDPRHIDYLLRTFDSSEDGFQFTPDSGALSCFRPTDLSGVSVFIGPDKQAFTGAFDLATLGQCLDIAIDDMTVNEGVGTVNFSVNLSASSANTVTVDYVTQAGTATADIDYIHVATPQTITFIPGETSMPVSISILDDSLMEGDEVFNVVLSNSTSATLNVSTGLGTISDDEGSACGQPIYDKATEKVMLLWKDCQTGEWFVRVTGGGDPALTTFVGDLTSAQDFLSVTGFSLEASDVLDNTTDPKKIDFVLNVADEGQDGFQFTPTSATGTCLDLQSPGVPVLVGINRLPTSVPFHLGTLGSCASLPDITINDVTVDEGASTASFTVALSAVNTQIVSVDFITQAMSAIADVDFTNVPLPVAVTFDPGEINQTIDIAILQDLDQEPDETFTVMLSNATNATILDNQGSGTITDDDSGLPDGDLAPLGALDGNINAADLLIGTRITLGMLIPTMSQLSHGDLYPPGAPDGVIDIQDLLLLRKLVLQ